jgi:hypothetical protein
MARDETTWAWWTVPPAISGCVAQRYRKCHPGLFPFMLDYAEYAEPRAGGRMDILIGSGSGTQTMRSASVGERRAARMDGYSPAIAPMTRAAPKPP